MAGPQPIDIPSVCERAKLLLQGDASQSGPKLNPAEVGNWTQRLSRIRLETRDVKVWEAATRLMAKLTLASECLSDAEASELAEEIRAFLRGSFEKGADSPIQSISELAEACARADVLLSTARELIPKLEGVGKMRDDPSDMKTSSDVRRLVEEISNCIDKATAGARDELRRLNRD